MADGVARIEVTEDGPYLVSGALPLKIETIVSDENGESIEWEEGAEFEHRESYALCRCGQSSNKPFCDGSHNKVDFDGTETAARESYEDGVKLYSGPTLDMKDNPTFCSVARFCDARGKAWSNVKRTDTDEGREIVSGEAMRCPSGRLVAVEKTDGDPRELEPNFETPAVGLIEDPTEGCSGPLWVQGGVEVVAADGATYEVRNRVTLCRCGKSANKPFCDGSHVDAGWRAEYPG
ncbi:MAG: CDGSH iron-sulfur domain-containing protein [Solirubrobacterales bacterium]